MNTPLETPNLSYRQWWRAFTRLFGGVGFIFDVKGRYVDVIDSGSIESLLYDDFNVLLGLQLHDVFSVDKADRFLALISRTIGAGEIQTIEYQIKSQAGIRWFEASLSPVPSEGDTPGHVMWLARDITENKQSEHKHRVRERRYEAIFNDPHILIGVLDSDGLLQRANQTALDIIGVDPVDVEDEPFWKMPWWSHSEALQTDLRRRIKRAVAGDDVAFEGVHYTAAGERIIVEGLLRPVMDEDGEVVSIIVSGRDMTEHEQQQQRLQVLHRILRHNLRNKVNVIQGQAELISKEFAEDDREEIQAMAETIMEKAADLSETAEKVQRFKQLAATHPTETVAVSDLFARVVDECREDHPKTTIEITTPNEDVDVPKSVELAVAEAVENAIEHHDRTVPTIKLACKIATDENRNQITLLITDDGPGIPENERDPLEAGEETALDHASSFGLWLIKWIVDSLGGYLTLTDVDPRGSLIELTIPLIPDDE